MPATENQLAAVNPLIPSSSTYVDFLRQESRQETLAICGDACDP
jgi:hypothetical protein